MAKDQIPKGHHRRPTSIGGSFNDPANIFYVEKRKHDAWHILFGNMNAYQICTCLDHIKYKPSNLRVFCKFIGGTPVMSWGQHNSKNKHKISYAWYCLFNGMDFLSIIQYINEIWLDPSYCLCVEKIEIEETQLELGVPSLNGHLVVTGSLQTREPFLWH
jgi:hypothetical protein